MNSHKTHKNGFSLLEVLVALVIVAVAVGSTLRVAQERTDTFDALRARLLARWVAQNQIEHIKTLSTFNPGTTIGSEAEAHINFNWTTQIDSALPSGAYPVSVYVTNDQHTLLNTQRTWITPQPPLPQTPHSDKP